MITGLDTLALSLLDDGTLSPHSIAVLIIIMCAIELFTAVISELREYVR